jgi:uncharacterized protein (TIGR00369 family)
VRPTRERRCQCTHVRVGMSDGLGGVPPIDDPPTSAPERYDPRMEENALYERIRESLSRQRMLTTLGASLERVADGEVEIAMASSEAIQQQHGFVHAGAVTTIADSACGYACLTRMPEGAAVLGVEFKINLLAPAVGDRFVATGRVVRMGKTIGVATADVVAQSAGKPDSVVAVMQATMMRVESRNGASG